MTLPAGARLGPYEVVAPLGAGGMGEVYRAKDPRLGRDVAVKVLPASFSQNPDRLWRFEQEARAASALNHPGILTIHDIGEYEGSPYVVSELLEGETLGERMDGSALPLRKALDYAVQVAHGLAAAHEKGIVHRDLKPGNLFVTKDGRLKILDFGLAKVTHPETREPLTKVSTQTAGTEPGVVMGTIGYMSPEQVRGLRTDHRSDLFAFGAILYEMLTGERAFQGATFADAMSVILKEDPPQLLEIGLRFSPGLEAVIRHCLEKSSDERFQSARDLAFALEETLEATARPVPQRLLGKAEPGRIRSLAVLPLDSLSRDPDQEFFADGMTEALISDLGKIRALRVISRTSAMRYKGTSKPLPEIARELAVDAIVEGSVLRSRDQVRITARLIHAATDRHLWSESYKRDIEDILALQGEVARAIAREIQVAISSEEQGRLAKNDPVNREAHRLYLLGRYWWNKRSPTGRGKALEYFQRSVAEDPTYAAAHAGIADTYSVIGIYQGPACEFMPKAKAAAIKALELDETLTEAHASLGLVQTFYDRDWSAAEKSFRRAIELNPGYASAHEWYSKLLSALGRWGEAHAEAELALEVDPFSLTVNHNLGYQHFLARRFDDAIEQLRRTLEMDPNYHVSRWWLARTYAEKELYRQAVAESEELLSMTGDAPWVLALLGYIRARSGDREEAIRILDLIKTAEHNASLAEVAGLVSVGLGDTDDAFAWLETASEYFPIIAIGLKGDPVYDPLRSDPRFAELLRRVGLPP
jgi:eukaryotic-like serine/threonine-protein kinase